MKEDSIRDFLRTDRHDFSKNILLESDAPSQPMPLFQQWFQEVIDGKIPEPYAFTLATSTIHGAPSARVVYMRDLRPDGIVFYTNYHSQKGQELSENPRFSANFFWAALQRQVRISGNAERIEATASDQYFASRPRSSQIGAWASEQSHIIESREVLEAQSVEFEAKFKDQEVPRPAFWGGFLLRPSAMEFWQGRESRLHDRLRYKLEGGKWTFDRLSP